MADIQETLEERGNRYGKYENVSATSQGIKTVMGDSLVRSGVELDEDMMESLDMIANKIARIVNGDPWYPDSWHDIAGYATLVANRLDES